MQSKSRSLAPDYQDAPAAFFGLSFARPQVAALLPDVRERRGETRI